MSLQASDTLMPPRLLSQGTNQQIKAHEASSAVQHVNLLKEWSNSLEKKVAVWEGLLRGGRGQGVCKGQARVLVCVFSQCFCL